MGAEPTRTPHFMNSDSFTEILSVPGEMSISSFAIKNNERYKITLVDHMQNSDHICDELIRLLIESISD